MYTMGLAVILGFLMYRTVQKNKYMRVNMMSAKPSKELMTTPEIAPFDNSVLGGIGAKDGIVRF